MAPDGRRNHGLAQGWEDRADGGNRGAARATGTAVRTWGGTSPGCGDGLVRAWTTGVTGTRPSADGRRAPAKSSAGIVDRRMATTRLSGLTHATGCSLSA